MSPVARIQPPMPITSSLTFGCLCAQKQKRKANRDSALETIRQARQESHSLLLRSLLACEPPPDSNAASASLQLRAAGPAVTEHTPNDSEQTKGEDHDITRAEVNDDLSSWSAVHSMTGSVGTRSQRAWEQTEAPEAGRGGAAAALLRRQGAGHVPGVPLPGQGGAGGRDLPAALLHAAQRAGPPPAGRHAGRRLRRLQGEPDANCRPCKLMRVPPLQLISSHGHVCLEALLKSARSLSG